MKNIKKKVAGILFSVFLLSVTQMAQPSQVSAKELANEASTTIVICSDPPSH